MNKNKKPIGLKIERSIGDVKTTISTEASTDEDLEKFAETLESISGGQRLYLETVEIKKDGENK